MSPLPKCTRCGYDREQHMEQNPAVLRTMLKLEERIGTREFWACEHCHAPKERILAVDRP
jgi:hypothetical protein